MYTDNTEWSFSKEVSAFGESTDKHGLSVEIPACGKQARFQFVPIRAIMALS
jgi:hypothetical protein